MGQMSTARIESQSELGMQIYFLGNISLKKGIDDLTVEGVFLMYYILVYISTN